MPFTARAPCTDSGTDLRPSQEVADAKACAPVLCMHRDGHGNIWSGHVGGGVGVWSETRRALCCPIFRACKSDIRCRRRHCYNTVQQPNCPAWAALNIRPCITSNCRRVDTETTFETIRCVTEPWRRTGAATRTWVHPAAT